MKKKHIIIISCVLAAGIILSGLALADSQRTGHRKDFGLKQHYKGGGLQLLAKYQQKNLMVQVLSEMTGQSVEAIQAKFKDQRMRTVMQELNVDRQAFRTAMQAKVREQVKQAVANGTITPEQEKDILTKMENRSKRRELMGQLIEKGIEDGTLTQEEAQMLMRKPR
jgi:polyhydroxyalkanoate synthesis regulator phasin